MILLIDNYDSFTYNLYQIIATLYTNVCVVRNDKITVKEVLQMKPSGVILSPGPGRPENAGICVELIQKLPKTTSLLGVCLGHQAISYAFGGRVIAAPEIVHGKSDLVYHVQEDIYKELPLPFEAGRYHSLMVDPDTLPSELTIDSRNAEGIIMGIRHKQRSIRGVQFHPESILTPGGEQLLRNYINYVKATY